MPKRCYRDRNARPFFFHTGNLSFFHNFIFGKSCKKIMSEKKKKNAGSSSVCIVAAAHVAGGGGRGRGAHADDFDFFFFSPFFFRIAAMYVCTSTSTRATTQRRTAIRDGVWGEAFLAVRGGGGL